MAQHQMLLNQTLGNIPRTSVDVIRDQSSEEPACLWYSDLVCDRAGIADQDSKWLAIYQSFSGWIRTCRDNRLIQVHRRRSYIQRLYKGLDSSIRRPAHLSNCFTSIYDLWFDLCYFPSVVRISCAFCEASFKSVIRYVWLWKPPLSSDSA